MSNLNGRLDRLEERQREALAADVAQLFDGLGDDGIDSVIGWLVAHGVAPALPEPSIWDCTMEQRRQWIAGARRQAREAHRRAPGLFDRFMREMTA